MIWISWRGRQPIFWGWRGRIYCVRESMGRLWTGGIYCVIGLGGAGAWLECYGFGEADWDFAAGGELCDSAGRAGCPRERIAIGTEIETYEFMDLPQIPPCVGD